MAKKSRTKPKLGVGLKQQRMTAKVNAAIKAIQKAFDLGIASRDAHGEDLYRRKKTKTPKFAIPEFAAQGGYKRDAVERARQFADVFDQETVEELCSECEAGKYPLGVSLIYRALSLGDLDECMELLRTAIRERWTARQMIAEVRGSTGAKSRSGRPRVMPKGPDEARQQIVSRFRPDLRWLNELNSHMGGQLDASLRKKIGTAVSALEALVEAAS